MTELADLIERVKVATGPDRELDCRLSHHFERSKGISYGSGDDSGWAPAETIDGWDDAKWATMGTEHVSSLVRRYTSSVDAVLALIEEKLPGTAGTVSFGRDDPQVAFIDYYDADQHDWQEDAKGATPALALLICLLTALQEQS